MQYPPLKTDFNSTGWQFWFDRLFLKFNRYGTTANRPINVEIGDQYIDTTLGMPIWVLSVNPNVWIRYDGTVV